MAAVLVPVLSLIPASAAGGEQRFEMTQDEITYYGRWEMLSGGGVQLNFQSGFEVIFTGTSIAVDIEKGGSTNEFIYSIDGGEPVRVASPKAGGNILATNLAAGDHTLTLYAATEVARLRVAGLKGDAGAVLKKVPARKTIEFIGDSITAGWIGNSYENWLRHCYTWQTAKKLGLAYNVVARGRSGLLWKGTDIYSMSERYFKERPYLKDETSCPDLDTSRYAPDYIVVNLGTNDRSYSGSQVEEAYTKFLAALREAYPNATIFALRPLGGRDITGGDGYFKKEIITAVNARRKAGDRNVIFIDTAGWVQVSDFSDDLHFNYEGNKHIAEKLAAALEKYIDDKAEPGPGSSTGSTTSAEPTGSTTASGKTSGTGPTGSSTERVHYGTGSNAMGSTETNRTNTSVPSAGLTSMDETNATNPSESIHELWQSTSMDSANRSSSGTDPATLPIDGNSSPTGWIIGGVAAGLLLLGGGGFALWYFVLRKKRHIER